MKIMFCGSVLPESAETRVKYISNAGNRFQNNLINAMKNLGHEVFVCSYIGFPVEHDYLVSLNNNTDTGYKYVFRCKEGTVKAVSRFRYTCKKVLNEHKPNVMICYNPLYAWFGLTPYAKKSGIKTILMLADYAGKENFTSHFSFDGIIRKIKARMELSCIRSFDGVVGLSSGVKSLLRTRQQFLHVEGGLNLSKWESFPEPDKNTSTKILMYSGSLSEPVGIDIAVNAFEKLGRSDTELYITGFGAMEEWVRDKAENNNRIHFLGRLEYDEYILMLRESNILLNPRNMNIPENRNNFPSKILEYFATGRVIVSTKFAGWERFEQNAYFTESSVLAFMEGIELALSEYEAKADEYYYKNRKLAIDFDWSRQSQKIIRFFGN